MKKTNLVVAAVAACAMAGGLGAFGAEGAYLGFNEDLWHFFSLAECGVEHKPDPKWRATCAFPPDDYDVYPANEAGLVAYLDDVLRGKVTHFFMNVNGQRAGFDSKTLEPLWRNFDKLSKDNPDYATVAAARLLHERGVDPYEVWCRRCREKGASPWISVRMNDMHVATRPNCPSISDWWRENPQFRRVPPGRKSDEWFWNSQSLDFKHPEVRDRIFAFIAECLERYDADGVELDWTRFPCVFAEGEERAGAPLLTGFMRKVRAAANAAAVRRGHAVGVSCRMLSCPEVETGLGLDVATWAAEGLVDMVDAGNHWGTADFEIPVERWRAVLGDKVRFVAHVDCGLSRPLDNAMPRRMLAKEEYLGWADVMRARGCGNFNFFNLFGHPRLSREWNDMLSGGLGEEVVAAGPRSYPLSHRDLGSSWTRVAPESATSYPNLLPADLSRPFRCEIPVGTVSAAGGAQVVLGFKTACATPPEVVLNGVKAIASAPSPAGFMAAARTYEFPLSAVRAGRNAVEVSAAPGGSLVYVAVRLDCGKGPAPEDEYAFRERLAVLHPPRRAADAQPPAADETLVGAGWSIAPESDDPVLLHGARDLADYFEKSMGVKVPVAAAGAKRIRVGVKPSLRARQSEICTSADEISVMGDTAREAAQGCYRLEDAMTARGLPAMKRGSRTFTRMFSPRMTHSGWEVEKFPDVYLDQIAHAGMDAILLFIADPPDVTRNGKEDVPALVERARLHGIDVYAYCWFHVKAAKYHPSDPEAPAWYEQTYGSIFKNAPGIKGIVCVGESVAFPSRSGRTASYWWGRKNERVEGKPRHGFYPVDDWPEWLELVKKSTRKFKPDAEIVFWTYNWYWAPEAERVKLLERIPTDVSLLVTFEMGDKPEKKLGIDTFIQDYSITRPGPGTVFASEAAVAAKRGIRLLSMTNTGGRTWDLGVAPFEPVPRCWLKRFRALRAANAKWGLSGLMECHHYGFMPNFIGEIAKAAFTGETDESSLAAALRGIAARDCGFANADAVLAAWDDWSDAFHWHSARAFDLAGPQRTGPTYPLVLPGSKFPLPLHPVYEYYEGETYGNGWKYLDTGYKLPPDLIEPYVEMTTREVAGWRKGNARLRAALANVPVGKRAFARRMLAVGEMFEYTARTLLNVRKFKREGLVYEDAKASARAREAARKALLAIVDDEEANVRETIPVLEVDSSLGWEPTMFYICDRANLEWKLRQLDGMRKELAAGAR